MKDLSKLGWVIPPVPCRWSSRPPLPYSRLAANRSSKALDAPARSSLACIHAPYIDRSLMTGQARRTLLGQIRAKHDSPTGGYNSPTG
eukprot:3183070-Pyramimonas_sp.AAC.1